jgi:anti-anti-sigma regulatory factor
MFSPDNISETEKKHAEYKIEGKLERDAEAVQKLLISGKTSLTLDFSRCTFLSVAGLEWLEEMLFRAESTGSVVTFVNLSPTLYKVLKVAHIDSLLKACGAPGQDAGPKC